MENSSTARGAPSSSDAARHTTQLVEQLARSLISERHGRHGAEVVPSEVQIHGAVRLCIRILTSHIGEPLMVEDEAAVAQAIRTRLVKTPSSSGSGVEAALRFDDLHRRLKLLDALKNRAPILHLLHSLSDTGTPEAAARRHAGAAGIPQLPPRMFSEPAAGLSGIEHVAGQGLGAPAGAAGYGRGLSNGRALAGEEGRHGEGMRMRMGIVGGRADGHRPWEGLGRTAEVTERTLLKGILYAFQGIDSQYIKYCEEESGYVLDPRLRLGRKQRALVTEMLEMGWLFTMVVRYIQNVDAGSSGLGSGRIQQAFSFSMKEDLTEYYRLIAVLQAQLNLDAEGRSGLGRSATATAGGTEGLTLQRLFVWVMDPLKRLNVMATLVSAAAQLQGGALASCLHTHVDHGDPFVRGLVHRTMVRACESLFYMLKLWMFEGELVDHHHEFFVQEKLLEAKEERDKLWREKYRLDSRLLPKFIDKELAGKILTIGKAINFLRRLCGDSEWIMGPMAKAAAQATALEYGNTASLRAVVESCSSLTNARLVHLMMGPYRLEAHLRVLKKFMLHGQGDLMLNLIEVLGPELDKKATVIYRHNMKGLVESVIKTSAIAQDEVEDVARIGVKILAAGERETGWDVFSLEYNVGAPISTVVTKEVLMDYRKVFHLLWRIRRAEWSLASAWRLHTSATHVRLEQVLPELRGALHQCSLIRGQMFFLTTNLSNYMMFEVLETSWGMMKDNLDSAATLDDLVEAHKTYMKGILARALLSDESKEVNSKVHEVLGIIIDFCRHQESLVIRAMAEVTTRRAEQADKERRTARGQWGTEDGTSSQRGGRRQGRDPFGMSIIHETARRYEAKLSELVCMLEQKSGKMEILRFLTFRLDFNDFYKERRAAVTLPPAPRHGGSGGSGGCYRSAARQRRSLSVLADCGAALGASKVELSERGYVKGLRVLDKETVGGLRAALPLLFRGEFDTGVYPDEMHWREGISRQDAPREIVNAWKANRTVAAVVLSEGLGRLAASLAGWDSARVAQDDVVWKPPGSGPVAFHQDSAYISRQFLPRTNNSVTMWIALDDCDGEGRSKEAALTLGRQVEFEVVAVPPGGCVVHAQDCWHGSGPNVSAERQRRALVVHFLRGDARFIDGHSLQGTGGPTYIYSRYKGLESTALPEEAFPVTFSQEGYRTKWIETFLAS
eukprot:g11722.t2